MRRSSVAKGCCHDAPKHCEYLGGNHKAQTCVGSVGGNEQFATSSYISPISDQAGLCRHCLVRYCKRCVAFRAHMSWSDAETKVGHLPPFEACKAFAFHKALETISENLGTKSIIQSGSQKMRTHTVRTGCARVYRV